jgi:hypothetical protein
MTQNEENAGKGMTRVAIAQRAYDRALALATAAEARLDAAIAAEGEAVAKRAEKKERALEAARALVAASDKAAKAINKKAKKAAK